MTVVTWFCGYLVLHHQLQAFITEVSERHHLRSFIAGSNYSSTRCFYLSFRISASTIRSQNCSLYQYRSYMSLQFRIYEYVRGKHATHHQESGIMVDYRVAPRQVQEDQITASIEKHTSQIPSSVYLAAALGAMAVSAGFHLAKKEHPALFIGQWAAPFLLLGIYNKLVKQHGSDAASRTQLAGGAGI